MANKTYTDAKISDCLDAVLMGTFRQNSRKPAPGEYADGYNDGYNDACNSIRRDLMYNATLLMPEYKTCYNVTFCEMKPNGWDPDSWYVFHSFEKAMEFVDRKIAENDTLILSIYEVKRCDHALTVEERAQAYEDMFLGFWGERRMLGYYIKGRGIEKWEPCRPGSEPAGSEEDAEDDRGEVIVYDREIHGGIVLAREPERWDGKTFDMGNGVRIHVHEWETPDPEDYAPDENGYVPSGYVYSEMDVQNDAGIWEEDVEGATIGYDECETLGAWLNGAYGL